MDSRKVFILLNLTFWLGHYIGRNNRIPTPTISSSPTNPMNPEIDWSVLESQQIIRDKPEDGSRRSPGLTTQSDPDTIDESPTSVARFSGARLVIEGEGVAAVRNAADINRWRQGFRGISG